ncbi:MAG: site-specific integrase, partial [Mesorhizobium sp.]
VIVLETPRSTQPGGNRAEGSMFSSPMTTPSSPTAGRKKKDEAAAAAKESPKATRKSSKAK